MKEFIIPFTLLQSSGGVSVPVAIALGFLILLSIMEMVTIAVLQYRHKHTEAKVETVKAELDYFTQHDAMTGLVNRARLMEKLQDMLLLNPDSITALMVIEIVNLGMINDAYGHDIGDRVLVHVSGILKEEFKEVQEQVGVHHTTFMVLDGLYCDREVLKQKAIYLVKRLSHTTIVDHMEISIKINMGIAVAPDHSMDCKLLLKKANIALVEAQKHGNNEVRIFQDNLYKNSLKRMTLEKQLRRAVSKNEFELHYQPRIDLETKEVCGCEALIRWRHPDGRLVYPNHFIPLAESVGFISDITKWVVRRVATQVMAWEAMGHSIKVSFNISGKEFDDEFITLLSRIITEEKVNPDLLEVEITETAALKDIEHSKFLVDTLNSIGVSVALDDFGTGYSSMTYIKKLKAGKLKIDRTFIEDIHEHEQRVVVESMVNLGQELKYRINVEGVETIEQLEILEDMQVDEIQGWYFSKSLPAQDFINYVRTRRYAEVSEEAQG